MTDSPPPDKMTRHVTAGQTILALALLAALSILLIVYGDWFLPVRISEGPMVQLADEHGAVLVWTTSRSADCAVTLALDSGDVIVPVEREANRHTARLVGLDAGCGYSYEICTGDRKLGGDIVHTSKTGDSPYNFIVFGDSGRAKREQYVLAGLMNDADPDFLLHTGDLVYPDGARRRYGARFFAPYRKLLARSAFWPCLGNHDVDATGAATPYISVFDLPTNGPPDEPAEHHYWFEYASARIAVVDSNVGEQRLREHVAPWLREVMASSAQRWKFVSLHHPPYTGGKYPPNLIVQQTLVPVFEETGVDVVFAGHDHNYQRIKPIWRGEPVESGPSVRYVVTGAGGARLYEQTLDSPGQRYVDVFYADMHSYSHVWIDGDKLDFRQVNVLGDTVDEWSIIKPAPATQPAGPS